MDNLTHSLVGALLGQAGLKRKTGLAMPALIIGANIPDIDATCVLMGNMQHLALRRGLTHGPIAWVLLPLLLAGALWGFDRWQAKRGKRPEGRLPVRFGWLYALSLLACLTHPALDWLNTYGIRLLEPFSDQWFYGDTLFIVDIWLWLGMGFAAWFSLRREKRGKHWRWPAVTALILAVGYIGWNWLETQGTAAVYAINSKAVYDADGAAASPPSIPGETFIASPVLFDAFEREVIVGEKNNWFYVPAGEVPGPQNARPMAEHRCAWPDTEALSQTRPDLKAFLFWSRAPFVVPAEDGDGIVFHDARFYGEYSRNGFYVEVKGVKCRELPAGKMGS